MANNSLTERVLSAKERGFSYQEISSYENVSERDVENIVQYWEDGRGEAPRNSNRVNTCIRRIGLEELRDFVERKSTGVPKRGLTTRQFVAAEISQHYRLEPELARDVADEIYLALDNLHVERNTARRDNEGYIRRIA